MILSNEPGYYKTGEYGIRTENLVLVTGAGDPPGAEKTLNAFETLSFAPIDRRLVDVGLLTRRSAPGSTAITRGCASRSGRWWMRRRGHGSKKVTRPL